MVTTGLATITIKNYSCILWQSITASRLNKSMIIVMHGVVLFARQQFVKLLSQSINYSSIPIQYCYSLTVTTINSQTTYNTVATATSVTTAVNTAVVLTMSNVFSFCTCGSPCQTSSIFSLFFFPNNFECFFLIFFCFICFDIFFIILPIILVCFSIEFPIIFLSFSIESL